MAQNIKQAIADVVATVRQGTKSWCSVHTEADVSGSKKDYNLEITTGAVDGDDEFERRNVSYGYTMTLKVTKEANSTLVPENCNNITRLILSDRRRGQNAQTTTVGEWTVQEDEGRSGIIMVADLTIRVIDKGDC